MTILTDKTVAFAPMDGVSTNSFREVLRKLHPNIALYSEFTNVKRVIAGDFYRLSPSIKPYFVQLFGNEPKDFEMAAAILNDFDISGIDINMGCSNVKIASSQYGAALMKDSAQAARIVAAVKKNYQGLVTVKTRLGWHDNSEIFNFAKELQNAGLDFITVHGRRYVDKFKNAADWENIYSLKEQLNIKVIGNGDINSLAEGYLKVKNLDGFMIGRAVLKNPYIFWDSAIDYPIHFRLQDLKEHLILDLKSKPVVVALNEIKKFVSGYLNGGLTTADNFAELRIKLFNADLNEFYRICDHYKDNEYLLEYG